MLYIHSSLVRLRSEIQRLLLVLLGRTATLHRCWAGSFLLLRLLLLERGQLLDYRGSFLLSEGDVWGADAIRCTYARRSHMEITRVGRDRWCLLLLLSDLFCIWSRKLHCLLLLCQLAYEFKLLLLEKGLSTHIFELVDADADLLVLWEAIATAVSREGRWACPGFGEACPRTLTNARAIVVEHHEVIAGEKRVRVQTQQAWSDQGRRLPDTTSRGRLGGRNSPITSTVHIRGWLFYGLSLLLRLLALLCLGALWADFLDGRGC